MLRIGCHLSISKGFEALANEALTVGGNTFQFFTRNPRGGSAKAIDSEDINRFLAITQKHDLAHFLAHAPYTMNVCAADAGIRQFSLSMMAGDLQRMEYIPGNLYNFHPGSHVSQGVEIGIRLIIKTLNEVLFPDQTTTVLLETMAGKGSEIGRSFEELRTIIDGVKLQEKMGVCLDTCHVHDAGYDIVNDLDGVLDVFDRVIGLDRLKAIHLNDSKNPFNSHKDRHELIGKGSLGIQTITRVINHPKLRLLPFYLETPNELPGYAQEIQLLKTLYHE